MKVVYKKKSEINKMASSCCGTKKQRMNNQQCNHNHGNNFSKTNGHSSTLTNGTSALTNGHSTQLTNGHSAPLTNGHSAPLTNGHSAPLTNGHSNHLTNGHSHHNGTGGVDQVANHDMCFFCFEVLYCELNRIDGPQEPSFTNDA